MGFVYEGTTFFTADCPTCGVRHAFPERLYNTAKQQRGPTGHHIYCPNGHYWYYIGETEAEKMRRQRDQAVQEQARLAEELAAAEKRERRLKTRIHAGVCPCCSRTFTNLARHMKTKHPDQLGPNVVKLKSA